MNELLGCNTRGHALVSRRLHAVICRLQLRIKLVIAILVLAARCKRESPTLPASRPTDCHAVHPLQRSPSDRSDLAVGPVSVSQCPQCNRRTTPKKMPGA
uniref:ORF100 n=1 Tax=Xanthomonas arboricola pv. pruni TaxID=69929 RepID=Q5D0L7_9XANT|nr:ORF100 [Xanthomonas arboricola pv. pruni]